MMELGRLTTALAAVLGLGLATGAATAGEGPTNAALRYHRAWALMAPDLHLGVLHDEDDFRLTDEGAARLEHARDAVERLIEASGAGEADWGIEYEEGPLALLPHLGQIRMSSRVVGYDALRCAALGDGAGAAARVAALYRMSEDVSHDRVIVSSLVAVAISNSANKLTRRFLDDGLFTPADARAVLDAIREMRADDRYGLRESIVGDWRMIAQYVIDRAPREGAGKWLLETMEAEIDDETARTVAGMDRQALLREIGGWSAYHGAVLDAWDSGEAGALDAVVERLREGEFGPLSALIAPNLDRAFDAHRRGGEDLDAVVRRLEGLATDA